MWLLERILRFSCNSSSSPIFKFAEVISSIWYLYNSTLSAMSLSFISISLNTLVISLYWLYNLDNCAIGSSSSFSHNLSKSVIWLLGFNSDWWSCCPWISTKWEAIFLIIETVAGLPFILQYDFPLVLNVLFSKI